MTAYECDDCEGTFSVELVAFQHAEETNHTVRYNGDGDSGVLE